MATNTILFDEDAFDTSSGVIELKELAALTAASVLTVDATFAADEATVVNNLRTRLNEIEARLKTLKILPA